MSDQPDPPKTRAAKPASKPEAKHDLQRLPLADVEKQLGSSAAGISQAEAQKRLAHDGPNEIEERKTNPFLKFLSYFWGPIPWMIEAAVILSAVAQHWPDFGVILLLLFANAVVGFWDFRGDPLLTTLRFALVLTVAAIPVAMPTVLSVTMAVGARLLARKEAIVTRLAAIEELAGVDIPCSDKTGTLTQNKLTLDDPFRIPSA